MHRNRLRPVPKIDDERVPRRLEARRGLEDGDDEREERDGLHDPAFGDLHADRRPWGALYEFESPGPNLRIWAAVAAGV